MKINLDTINKTVGIEDRVKFGEFLDMMKKLLPNGLWKEYFIQSTTEVKWYGYPQTVAVPYIPWGGTSITYCSSTGDFTSGDAVGFSTGSADEIPQGKFQLEC